MVIRFFLLLLSFLCVGVGIGFATPLQYSITSDTTCEVIHSDKYESLTSVEIPETTILSGKEYRVTGIGRIAFFQCKSLAKVSLPNSISSIGAGAFEECVSLKEVDIPQSVTILNERAFMDCESLERVTLPFSLRSIGDFAFGNCGALRSVRFPQSLDSIGANAFALTALTEVDLPRNLKYIGKAALAGLNLKSVRLPDSLTVLPAGLFLFTEIDELSIPSTVKRVEPMAFAGVMQVKRLLLNWERPEDVDMEITAFDYSDMDSVEFVVPDGTFDLYYEKLSEELRVPYTCQITEKSALDQKREFRWRLERKTLIIDKADFNYVNSVDLDYFNEELNCDKVDKLVVNEGVTRIPCGFGLSFHLEEIQLPASLREIAVDGLPGKVNCSVSSDNPFYVVQDGFLFDKRDSSIVLFLKDQHELFIPAYVKSIRSSAFWGCFDSIRVEEGNPYFSVRENVLFSKNFDTLHYYGSNLKQKEYVIPETVTTIGDYAFSGKLGLEMVQFNNGLKRIGRCAFLYSGLRKMVLPPSVEYVGSWAFDHNTHLTFVDLSSTKIKTLGHFIFYGCKRLTDIVLPNGLETILQDCLGETKHLAKIDLPTSLKVIQSPFDGSAIKSLHIPDNVIWIQDGFSEYNKIKDVYLNWRGGSVYNNVYTDEKEYRIFNLYDYDVSVRLHVADDREWLFWKDVWEVKLDIKTNR